MADDTWSSHCDVAVFTTARQRGTAPAPVDTEKCLSNRVWQHWSHGWRLKPLVPWNDGGHRSDIPADQGLRRLCVLSPRHNNTAELIHVRVRERPPNRAAVKTAKHSLWWLRCKREWRKTKERVSIFIHIKKELTLHTSRCLAIHIVLPKLFCPSCVI